MTLNPNFISAVQRLHPGVNFKKDVLIQDNSDGNGPFLVAWNLPGNPPTDAEIAAALQLPFPPLPQQAQAALATAQDTAIKCLMFGVPFPPQWQTYANSLSQVVAGTSTTMPTQPILPPLPITAIARV